MGIFATTLLPLSLCFLIFAPLSATASQSSNFADRDNDENTASSQTTANLIALEAKISAMQADLTALKAMHCQTGKLELHPHGRTAIVYGKDTGRRHTKHVNFPLPFNTVPWVAISLSMVDSYLRRNLRVITTTSSVSTSGFDASAIEWSDTRTFNVVGTWVACNV